MHYVIHAISNETSPHTLTPWKWVSKAVGHPFTTFECNARRYKTYDSAVRAAEKLLGRPDWAHVGNDWEVYTIGY